MKANLFFMAAAALALASCSNEELVEVNNGNAIDFRVAMGSGSNSRGAETTTGNLGKFYVTAINSEQLYFENVLFTGTTSDNTTTFTSNPEYYWPGDGSDVDFYAYSYYVDGNLPAAGNDIKPYVGDVKVTNDSKVIEGFTPQTAVKDQIDLVTAVGTGSKTNANEGMALSFKHVLSQIQIQAKNENENYIYEVVGVKIGNIASTGNYTFTTEENASSWSDQSGSTVYEVALTKEAEEGEEGEDNTAVVTLGNTAADIMGITALGGTGAMIVPQSATSWDPTVENSNGAYIAVKLKITMAKTKTQIYPKTGDYAYTYVAVPANTVWVEGKKYIYTLNFTNGAGYTEDGTPILGEPIQFSNVVVKDWTAENPQPGIEM